MQSSLFIIEPRRASAQGESPYRMNEMIRQQQQRGPQQPSFEGSGFHRGSMDDLVLRQQQLLRQEQQYQGAGNSNVMQDFGLPSQGQQSVLTGMPSLMEISRAEEILAAAREALTGRLSGGMSRTAGGRGGGQFGAEMRRGDTTSHSIFGQPEGRWSSAYNPTPLRPPGSQALNAPIATTGGLGNQDLRLLLSKKNQGLSLATANASQQQSSMRQAMINQMPAENMGVSLLLRQEEERLLMNKRQRGEDSPPKKFPGSSFGMNPQQLSSQMMTAGKTAATMQSFGPSFAPKPRKRRAKTFPVKLMECLMAHYDERYVAWLPDGRSFVIVHPENFIDKIVSLTFKNSKYASFVRKLNRWGFARLTSGTGTDCFYHPLFQRDRIDLAAQMLCMPRNDSKSAMKRKEMGVEAPGTPIITAADMHPQDCPSLAGVERFISGKEQTVQRHGSPKDSDATESDDEHASPDDRKQAATSTSVAPSAAASPPGECDKAPI